MKSILSCSTFCGGSISEWPGQGGLGSSLFGFFGLYFAAFICVDFGHSTHPNCVTAIYVTFVWDILGETLKQCYDPRDW